MENIFVFAKEFKVLLWKGDRLALLYKRLENGSFQWGVVNPNYSYKLATILLVYGRVIYSL